MVITHFLEVGTETEGWHVNISKLSNQTLHSQILSAPLLSNTNDIYRLTLFGAKGGISLSPCNVWIVFFSAEFSSRHYNFSIKDQLVLKGLNGILEFFQKMNEFDIVLFVCFFGRIIDLKESLQLCLTFSERWQKLGYFNILPSLLRLVKVAPRWR